MSGDTLSGKPLHPTDPEILACPYPYYAQVYAGEHKVRDEGPIGWIVGGFENMSALGTDTKHFSNQFFGPEGTKLIGASPEPPSEDVLALVAQMHPMANALVLADPPLHTRQKAIAIKSLNAHRVREMEPKMHEVINGIIDEWIDDGHCEFVSQFAIWVPLTMICHALGIPPDDLPTFKVWTDHIEAGYLEPLDNEQREEVTTSVLAFQKYILRLIAERRENPTGDLLSALVHNKLQENDEALREVAAAAEGRDERSLEGADLYRQLSDAEILTMVSQLFAAGNHTTTSAMGNLMVALIERPQQMADLRAHPELIADAVHETVRRDSPVRCLYRITPGDVEVDGVTIPAGSQVMAHWGLSGHDPTVFPDPAEFDVHRPNVRKHMGFGHGPHFCVGSQLARTQIRIAFETLLRRLEDIRFAPGKPPVRMLNMAVGGFDQVHLEFTKATG
jgi:cytochrome P450